MSDKAISAARDLLAERFGEHARDAFIADPHVQTAAGGGAIVHFQQYYAGIPLFAGNVAVHLDDGLILGSAARPDTIDCVPSISAVDAVSAALAHFRSGTDRAICRAPHPRSLRGVVRIPTITNTFPLPSRLTVLHLPREKSSPLAHLEIDAERLVWVIRLRIRERTYLLLIGANSGDAGNVVFCTRWSSGAKCSGTVVGFDGVKSVQAFPVPPAMFPAPLLALPPAALLGDWCAVNETIGNNVVTHAGNLQTLLRAGAGGVFAPATTPREQSLLNAFFFCNYLHDFFLLLGFGEAEGNFQLINASGAPGGGDRLKVLIFKDVFDDLGDMEANLDGKAAELSLGNAPNGEPVALHADVVIHEYAHGVAHRMVGGRRGAATLFERQSRALDEAWSDYFAITLRNHHLATPNFNFAEWAGLPKPARSAPYDASHPGTFDKLGRPPYDTAHGAGEIFASALIRFNAILGDAIGAVRGNCIGWRAVVESLKHVQPSNPTLLEGRDALFRAITELAKGAITPAEGVDARAAARKAFARCGMGPAARGPKSNQLAGTTADFQE